MFAIRLVCQHYLLFSSRFSRSVLRNHSTLSATVALIKRKYSLQNFNKNASTSDEQYENNVKFTKKDIDIIDSKKSEKEKKKEEYAEIVEQVRVMNEYFSQYVDEYYVDEDSAEFNAEEEAASHRPTKEERLQALVELYKRRELLPSVTHFSAESLVELLRQQRAKEIVCLRMPIDKGYFNEFIVICEAHNSRHAQSVIMNVRKYIKDNYRFLSNNILPPRVRNGPTPEWYSIDFRTVVLHMLTSKARKRYNLEALYGVGEDDVTYAKALRPAIGRMNLGIDEEFLPPPLQIT